MIKNKIGVFIGRMHPFHNGHKQIIENMLKMHDKVLIILGSKDKVKTDRNPFSIDLRRDILRKEYENNGKVIIETLDDLTNEEDNSAPWGEYLMEHIIDFGGKTSETVDSPHSHFHGRIITSKAWGNKQFVLHYSDSPAILDKWWPDGLPEPLELFIHNRTRYQSGVSATMVRRAILSNDYEFIRDNCPESTCYYWPELVKELKETKFTYEPPTDAQIEYGKNLGIYDKKYKYSKQDFIRRISKAVGKDDWAVAIKK